MANEFQEGNNEKNSMQRISIEKCLPVYGGKCLWHKMVHNWIEKFSQGRSKAADDKTAVQTWMRQQSRDFYVAGFDTGKAMEQVQDMSRNKFFFQVRISHILRFISICEPFLTPV
jgi:hypothetical protein